MPTYPTALKITPRSNSGGVGGGVHDQWRDPIILSTARSGATRGRRLAATKKRVWQISHVYLTATEKTTLETFYDANRSGSFTFQILGASYNVIFADELDWEALPFALWLVRVTLIEV